MFNSKRFALSEWLLHGFLFTLLTNSLQVWGDNETAYYDLWIRTETNGPYEHERLVVTTCKVDGEGLLIASGQVYAGVDDDDPLRRLITLTPVDSDDEKYEALSFSRLWEDYRCTPSPIPFVRGVFIDSFARLFSLSGSRTALILPIPPITMPEHLFPDANDGYLPCTTQDHFETIPVIYSEDIWVTDDEAIVTGTMYGGSIFGLRETQVRATFQNREGRLQLQELNAAYNAEDVLTIRRTPSGQEGGLEQVQIPLDLYKSILTKVVDFKKTSEFTGAVTPYCRDGKDSVPYPKDDFDGPGKDAHKQHELRDSLRRLLDHPIRQLAKASGASGTGSSQGSNGKQTAINPEMLTEAEHLWKQQHSELSSNWGALYAMLPILIHSHHFISKRAASTPLSTASPVIVTSGAY